MKDTNFFVKLNKGYRLNATLNIKEVSAELCKLGKQFTPKNIVDVAKNKNNPLHKYFEWNDSKAAQEYRLMQARSLILSVGVVKSGEKVRAFENIVIANNKHVYMPHNEVVKDETLINQVIISALDEIKFWKEKYQKYNKIFGGIFVAIDKADKQMRVKYGKKSNKKGSRNSRSKTNNTKNK